MFRLDLLTSNVYVYQELLSAQWKIGEKSVPCRPGRQKSLCSKDNVFKRELSHLLLIPTCVLKNQRRIKQVPLMVPSPGNCPMCREGGVDFVGVIYSNSIPEQRCLPVGPLMPGETKTDGDRDRTAERLKFTAGHG